MHYHVGANTPGYLPEGDTAIMTSKKEAIAHVASEAREYRESQCDLPRSERRTSRDAATSGRIHFERPNDSYDLGLAFWWQPCSESDCRIGGDD